jgi:hypothetical protein
MTAFDSDDAAVEQVAHHACPETRRRALKDLPPVMFKPNDDGEIVCRLCWEIVYAPYKENVR